MPNIKVTTESTIPATHIPRCLSSFIPATPKPIPMTDKTAASQPKAPQVHSPTRNEAPPNINDTVPIFLHNSQSFFTFCILSICHAAHNAKRTGTFLAPALSSALFRLFQVIPVILCEQISDQRAKYHADNCAYHIRRCQTSYYAICNHVYNEPNSCRCADQVESHFL